MVALLDSYCGLYMANTAELYGEQQGITRQAQDEFALRSQHAADAAYKAGRLQEELTPVPLRNSKGEATGSQIGVEAALCRHWARQTRRYTTELTHHPAVCGFPILL